MTREEAMRDAAEYVSHRTECPSIGGNGDADCRCGAVAFLDMVLAALGSEPPTPAVPVDTPRLSERQRTCRSCKEPAKCTEPLCQPAPVDTPACPDGQHSYRRNAPPRNGDVCFVCRQSIWFEAPVDTPPRVPSCTMLAHTWSTVAEPRDGEACDCGRVRWDRDPQS